MSERLHGHDFLPHLHASFRIHQPISLELELAEIEDRSNEVMEQFSLIFTGPASAQLQQGTYTLQHPAMGDQDLFLVPLGPRGALTYYQALFSHLREK